MRLRSMFTIMVVAAIGCSPAANDADTEDADESPDASEVTPEAPASNALAGTVWRLQDLGGQAAMPDVEATLQFEDGGRVSGRASCNQFGGSATISSETITFEPLILTRMACEDAIMAQEDRYVRALEAAQRYTINGDELLIHSSVQEQPLRFTRAS